MIIQKGAFTIIGSERHWYSLPGTINGAQGVYTIGVNSQEIIYHRSFSNYYPVAH